MLHAGGLTLSATQVRPLAVSAAALAVHGVGRVDEAFMSAVHIGVALAVSAAA